MGHTSRVSVGCPSDRESVVFSVFMQRSREKRLARLAIN
jgi:hypothetical protein